jgi:hypothetical protein
MLESQLRGQRREIGWIIFVVEKGEGGVPKQSAPLGRIEIWEHFKVGRHSGKPIVKHDVPLWRNGTGSGVQDKSNAGGVLQGDANIHCALASWLPAWDLLAVRDGFIKDVHGAAPNMEFEEAAKVPASLGEEVLRRETGFCVWRMVVQEHSLLYSHRPQTRIGHVWPVDCRV